MRTWHFHEHELCPHYRGAREGPGICGADGENRYCMVDAESQQCQLYEDFLEEQYADARQEAAEERNDREKEEAEEAESRTAD